jgi:hypothetical protein
MVLLVGGCVTWRPFDLEPSPSADKSLPYLLRATRHDSSRIVLTAPFVRANTLYGRMRRDTVSLPVSEILRLERERLSLDRTLAIAIGVPVMALGVTYLVVCGSNDCNPGF